MGTSSIGSNTTNVCQACVINKDVASQVGSYSIGGNNTIAC